MHNTEPISFCCRGLQNLFEERGRRGLSLLIKQDGPKYFCVLQSNAAAVDDVRKVDREGIRLPVDMTLRLQRAISHCPFCGTDLREWLVANRGAAEKGAQLSQVYLLPEQ